MMPIASHFGFAASSCRSLKRDANQLADRQTSGWRGVAQRGEL